MKRFGWGVLLVLVVGWGLSFVPSGGGRTPARANPAGVGVAWQACKRAVSARLVSPATARFHDRRVLHETPHVRVTARVTSENAFGGTLTAPFECEVVNGRAAVRLGGD